MKRCLVLLIFLSINFDKAIAMVPKNFAPRITYYAKNIYLFNNYIRQIKDSSGSAAQESFNKAQDLLNNIEKNLKVDLENNPVLRAYIDKKDFDIPTQRAILESIKPAVKSQKTPSEKKVSQEKANQLADELIQILEKNKLINGIVSEECGNLAKIEELIKNGANINKIVIRGNNAQVSVLGILMTVIDYRKMFTKNISKNCLEVLKLVLSQQNLNVNETDITGKSSFCYFIEKFLPSLLYSNVNKNIIKNLLKLFFERNADLKQKCIYGRNFFETLIKPEKSYERKGIWRFSIAIPETARAILEETYIEYLKELKNNKKALCAELDKNLAFMSKDLTDLIAGYAQECSLKRKEDCPA